MQDISSIRTTKKNNLNILNKHTVERNRRISVLRPSAAYFWAVLMPLIAMFSIPITFALLAAFAIIIASVSIFPVRFSSRGISVPFSLSPLICVLVILSVLLRRPFTITVFIRFSIIVLATPATIHINLIAFMPKQDCTVAPPVKILSLQASDITA